MSKETFKEFVKKNPKLVKYIKNNEMTWQKFYEMYDMYGEDDEVWKPYLVSAATTTVGVSDFLNYFKNINLDSVQESITSIQRVLGVVGDLTGKTGTVKEATYEPKPLYKHFDD